MSGWFAERKERGQEVGMRGVYRMGRYGDEISWAGQMVGKNDWRTVVLVWSCSGRQGRCGELVNVYTRCDFHEDVTESGKPCG